MPIALASASVAAFLIANLTATALGPDTARTLLLISAIAAVGVGTESAAWDPRMLPATLALSLPPVAALAADGSPSWLIGPLATLLLVGGELNSLSWEFRGRDPGVGVARSRLLRIGRVAALGAAGSLAVWAIAFLPTPGGTAAVVVAAAALAGVAWFAFRSRDAGA